MSLIFEIKNYEVVEDHIEYNIEVIDILTAERWKVKKRYSDLFDLYKKFKSLEYRIPDFPEKRFFGGKDPVFLEKRRGDLENYLNTLLKFPIIAQNSDFLSIFKPFSQVFSSFIVSPEVKYKTSMSTKETHEFSMNVNRSLNQRFIDLSLRVISIDKEQSEKKKILYETVQSSLTFTEFGVMPVGHRTNEAYYKVTVVKQSWIFSSFTKILNICKGPFKIELFTKYK